MQRELGIERKNIGLSIEDEKLKLETPNTSMQFKLEWFVAGEMINHLRALMVPPFIQKEGMLQDIDGKTLMLDFVMNGNAHWMMDMTYGYDNFYTDLSRDYIGKIACVSDNYLNS